jgi:hypothetical protein
MAKKSPEPEDLPFDVTKMEDPKFKAPDIIGTVEGWRAWVVQKEMPRFGVPIKLESAVHSFYWTPRQIAVATCDTCGEDVPGEMCSCGFYSARDLDHLLSMPYYRYEQDADTFRIVGRVANWGKVVPGTLGWRAQKSYPVTLYVPFEFARDFAKPIKESYGVPVLMKNFLSKPAKAVI